MPKLRSALFLLPVAFPAPCFADEHIDAPAAELRDLCTERPGLTTAACTVDPGHLQVEIGLADWERDTDSDARQDQLRLSDVQLRYGLIPNGTADVLGAFCADRYPRLRGR